MMNLNAQPEIDPIILKCLPLLHSRDLDSKYELRYFWEESIRERYGKDRVAKSIYGQYLAAAKKKEAAALAPTIVIPSDSDSDEDDRKRRRHPAPPLKIDTSSDEDTPVKSSCCHCKKFSSQSNNAIVECVECRKSYHQRCHFPPISSTELADPRFVWYCGSCETDKNERKSAKESSKKVRTEYKLRETAATTERLVKASAGGDLKRKKSKRIKDPVKYRYD